MKTLKLKYLFIGLLCMTFVACEKNETFNATPENQTSDVLDDHDKIINYTDKFWENENISESDIEAYYDKIDKYNETVVLPELDLNLLNQPVTDSENKFFGSQLFGATFSWVVGKGLDELFSSGSNSGAGLSNRLANISKSIRELDKAMNKNFNTVIKKLNRLPKKNQMKDGQSRRSRAKASMLKGDWKTARKQLAGALAKFRTALPYSSGQFVGTLSMLAECNKRAAKNRGEFIKNMRRVQVEAQLCFDAFQRTNRKTAQNQVGGGNNFDQILTSINFASRCWRRGRSLPKSGNHFIRGVKSYNGFLIANNHPKWKKGANQFKFSFSNNKRKYNRFAFRNRGGNRVFEAAKRVNFDKKNQYRFIFGRKDSKISEADRKFIIAPYNSNQYIVITEGGKKNDVRTFARRNNLYGTQKIRRTSGSSLLYNTVAWTVVNGNGKVVK